MPNTSCMIYMILPANFHNPNSFNSFCTTSKAVEAEEVTAVVEPAELSPSIERRSHPAQSGETFDGPPTLERSGSEHRVGRLHPRFLRKRGLGKKWSSLWKGRRRNSKNFDRLYKSRKSQSSNPRVALTQSPHSSDARRYESTGR